MSLKHKIVTTVMFGAPVVFGGCTQNGVVIGKADNKIVLTNVKSSQDTLLIKFDGRASGAEYYRRVNIGDTLSFSGFNSVWNSEVRNTMVGYQNREYSRVETINGRTLNDIICEEEAMQKKQLQSEAIRKVMEQTK